MSQYVDNLTNYHGLGNTESCYLDGRYFNLVFANYPGLLPNHLHIDISETKVKTPTRNEIVDNTRIFMGENKIDTRVSGLLRVVIHTPETIHSNLLIIDYNSKKIYRFEPLGRNGPYYDKVTDLIANYLGKIFPFDVEVIDVEFPFDEKNENCQKSGFCTAYNILYAYSYLNRTDFNPSNIRKFAKLIETKYGPLPKEGAQIEYGRGGYGGGHYHGGYHRGGYGRGYGGYGGIAPFIGGVGLGLGLGLPLAGGYGYGYPGYYPAYGYGYPGYGYGYGYGPGVETAVAGGVLGGALGAAALSGGL